MQHRVEHAHRGDARSDTGNDVHAATLIQSNMTQSNVTPSKCTPSNITPSTIMKSAIADAH